MRRLKNEELKQLHKEFVSYLIMNGLDSSEWDKVKDHDPNRAEQVIVDFSHQYFKVMLNGIHFATLKDGNTIHAIHCMADECTEFVLFDKEGESNVAHRCQAYKESRNQFLFEKLEAGFVPDKGEIFKEFAILFAQKKSN